MLKRTGFKKKSSGFKKKGSGLKTNKPLQAKTSLKNSGSSLKKSKAMKKGSSNPDKFKKQFHSKERVLFVQSLPCLVCSCVPSENDHFKERSLGGTYLDIIPLCKEHHGERHFKGTKTWLTIHDFSVEYIQVKCEETEQLWQKSTKLS